MKKINIELIKDLFISLLITISIILVISVIFYDKISVSRVIPEAEEYMLTDEMLTDLNQSYTENVTEIITNYSIDAADLKQYEKTKENNKGKKNPFAVESDSTSPTSNNVDGINNSTTTSPTSNTFYEDDGTK